jgi:hypothetical protein
MPCLKSVSSLPFDEGSTGNEQEGKEQSHLHGGQTHERSRRVMATTLRLLIATEAQRSA